ncbi:hypothetical protein FRX31_018441 [Thalictrum thalictroides]|uniref:Uncharacterized protein n=1 Tax=Thalictrum thalictroides TaxID=46969 RepID=A0A7J6W600_THATH|nr:hypothetical protein FRX31_018441 [Thalictrum thalictroides]
MNINVRKDHWAWIKPLCEYINPSDRRWKKLGWKYLHGAMNTNESLQLTIYQLASRWHVCSEEVETKE